MFKNIIIAVCLLGLVGCSLAPVYKVSLTGDAQRDIPYRQTYEIIPTSNSVKISDPDFVIFKNQLAHLMADIEIVEAKNGIQAEITILADFGIERAGEDSYTVGSVEYEDQEYRRYFNLVAIDAGHKLPRNSNEILWSLKVFSIGTNRNLSEVLPAMIAAAEGYIATNTETPIVITIAGDDEKVKSIKGI